ncbi:unnamed protein product, partial [Porites lobata]
IEALEKQVSADSVDRALVCVRQLAGRPVGLSDETAIVAALESLADVSRSAGHVDFKRHEAILKQCRPLTHDPRLPAVVTQLLGDDESKKIAGQIQKILKSDHLFSAPQVHGSPFPAPARAPGYLRQQGSGRGRYTPYGYGSYNNNYASRGFNTTSVHPGSTIVEGCNWEGVAPGPAAPVPSPEAVSKLAVKASVRDLRFRNPVCFRAGNIHNFITRWEEVLTAQEKRAEILSYLRDGVDVNSFFAPYKGDFQGKFYDSPIPPSACFPNSKSCEEFTDFISSTISQRLANEDKKRKFAALRESILDKKSSSIKTLQRLAGKITSFCIAVPAAQLYCREIFKATAGYKKSARPVKIHSLLREEIEHWRFLDSWEGTLPWPSERHIVLEILSDASDYAWGGVIRSPGAPPVTIRDYWTASTRLPLL